MLRVPEQVSSSRPACEVLTIDTLAAPPHITATNGWSRRDLYRTLETPGAKRLRDAHAALDAAEERCRQVSFEELSPQVGAAQPVSGREA